MFVAFRSASTAVTVRVVALPSRRTRTWVGEVPEAAIALTIPFQSFTSRVPHLWMTSPGLIPAAAAGAGVRQVVVPSRQEETVPTVDEGFGVPIPHRTTSRQTSARTRLVNGPPNMTTSFLAGFSRQKARSSSPGAISSALSSRASSARVRRPLRFSVLRSGLPGGSIPAMRTKPPRGRSLIPYSVPLTRLDHRVGPKPMKYCETFTPNLFAGTRWPSSWMPTETSSATTRKRIPSRVIKLPSIRVRGREPRSPRPGRRRRRRSRGRRRPPRPSRRSPRSPGSRAGGSGTPRRTLRSPR